MAAAGAAIIVGVVVALTRSGGDDSARSAASNSPSAPLTKNGAPPRSNRSVALAALQSISRVSTTARLENGKPIVFFMGGQFCPFCAADRWAFVKATSRFGTWTNLRPLHSRAGTDGFDSLPTYDLVNASYQSDLLSLHHKEIADADGNPLQPLAGVEQDFVNQFDPQGGIPFTVASGPTGQYTVGLSYSPALIQGQSFDALRAAVDGDANTPAVRAIDDEADAMTALLCKTTGGKPGNVCSIPTIQALTSQLP